MGSDVHRLVYPDWRSTQASVVEAVCRTEQNEVWVAVVDGHPVGFVAIGFVEEGGTRAGEVYMLAVDPTTRAAASGPR